MRRSSSRVDWRWPGRTCVGCSRKVPTPMGSLPSTTPTLSSEPGRPLLLDDRVLVALLTGEALPRAVGAECFTTAYFYYRACRAVVIGAGGNSRGRSLDWTELGVRMRWHRCSAYLTKSGSPIHETSFR